MNNKVRTTVVSVALVLAAGGIGFGASQYASNNNHHDTVQTTKHHKDAKKDSTSKKSSSKKDTKKEASSSSSSVTQTNSSSEDPKPTNDQIAWQQYPDDNQYNHDLRVRMMSSNNPVDVDARTFDSHALEIYKIDYAVYKFDLGTINSSVMFADSPLDSDYYNYVKAIDTPEDQRTPEQQDAIDNSKYNSGNSDDDDSDYDSNDDYDDEDEDY